MKEVSLSTVEVEKRNKNSIQEVPNNKKNFMVPRLYTYFIHTIDIYLYRHFKLLFRMRFKIFSIR